MKNFCLDYLCKAKPGISVLLFPLLMALMWAPLTCGSPECEVTPVHQLGTTLLAEGRADVSYNPSLYTIRIDPDYESPIENTIDFHGTVTITFTISSKTDEILLHADTNMTILDVEVKNGKNTVKIKKCEAGDLLKITTSSKLNPGTIVKNKFVATIKFSGKIQSEMHGFYKATYKTENNETRVVFATHFKPGYARKAFPCFDEPSLKAQFQLSISVPDNYNALSNTDPETTRNESGFKNIVFQTTPKMSSYLMGLFVYETSTFSNTATGEDNSNIINTWTRNDNVARKLIEHTHNISHRILEEYENFTDIHFNKYINKLDQIALPVPSVESAENWGLIIYPERRIFYNENEDPEICRKNVATIIAHELAYQWFGNLVTTSSWDTAWLNDGIATYFQYLMLSRIFPTWRMMDEFLLDQQMAAFSIDSVSTSDSLIHNLKLEEEISEQDRIFTYTKGACILRMVNHIMGEEKFQEGIQNYLQQWGTKSVSPEDFFKSLGKYLPEDRQPDLSFQDAMDTWVKQPGFPVIHIERDYENLQAKITQYRFFTDGTVEEEPTLYHIPVMWSTKDNATQKLLWFTENVTLRVPEIENWLLVHANGYYRVNYDETNWLTLSWTLAGKHQSRVSPADRAQLVDDALVLTMAGKLSFRILGYILRYLPHETDILPWAAADHSLRELEFQLGNIDTRGVFYVYMRDATSAVYDALNGFSELSDAPELIFRRIIIYWACRAGNSDCLNQALYHLNKYIYEKITLDPNLKEEILCYGTRAGDKKVWYDLWNLYDQLENTEEKLSLLKALGCTEDHSLIFEYLQRSVSHDNGTDSPDSTNVQVTFQTALSHPKGITATLDFVIQNITQMSLPESMINTILDDLTDHLTVTEQYQIISRFLEERLQKELIQEELVDELLDKVKKNVYTAEKLADDALKIFAIATPKTSTVSVSTTQKQTVTTGGSSHHVLFKLGNLLALTVSLQLLLH